MAGLLSKLYYMLLLISTAGASNTAEPRVGGDGSPRLPTEIGMVLFPTVQPIDVFGPLDLLTTLSWQQHLNLYLLASDFNPVSTAVRSPAMNAYNSSFYQEILPTHTYDSAPNLDVLFVPGGIGTRAPDINTTVDFVREKYPSLQYIVSICTGASILARAGVLDGKNATTNKGAWNFTTSLGLKTNWIAHARWVTDGNTWTTSGLTAGIDGTLGWIERVYGNETADRLALMSEYVRQTNPSWDPFAEHYELVDKPPVQ